MLKASLIGFITGVLGTGFGGIIGILINKNGSRFYSSMLEFTAGLMMGVVCFDLIPEAFTFGGPRLTIFGIILGVTVIFLIENHLLNRRDIGIMLFISISLHNFPEGLAIGAGLEASISIGFKLALAIFLHDLPEGIAMAVPFKKERYSNLKIIALCFLSGIPTALGAFIGIFISKISVFFITVSLGFAAGAMLYVICFEILPESKNTYKGRLPALFNVIGILAGITISRL